MRKTESKEKAQLHRRLEAWDNAVAAIRTNCKGSNWLHYTAAAGAALAMATDASAGVIYTNGPVKAGPIGASSEAKGQFTVGGAPFRVFAGNNFSGGFGSLTAWGVTNSVQSGKFGHRGQILMTSSGAIRKLASGAAISGGLNTFEPGSHLLKNFRGTFMGGQRTVGFFTASKPAFAGIRFTQGGTAGHTEKTAGGVNTAWQYGWVRLEFKDPPNIVSLVEAIDWAYQSAPNTSITAGQGTPSGTPEPGTLALSLLALGAAGVVALRRKKATVSA